MVFALNGPVNNSNLREMQAKAITTTIGTHEVYGAEVDDDMDSSFAQIQLWAIFMLTTVAGHYVSFVAFIGF